MSDDPMPDDPLKRVNLFVALADGHTRLRLVTEGLDDASAATPVHGEWSVRDLLAHVAAWDEQVDAFLRAATEGRREFEVTISPDDEWAAWNAAQVDAARAITLADLGARAIRAHTALTQTASALDEALLDERIAAPWGVEDTPRGYLVVQAVHSALHAGEIAEALGIPSLEE